MAFRRRRSTFRGSTGSLGWISWNRSGKDGTLGLGRCLRPLPGFRILGRVALETVLDCLVENTSLVGPFEQVALTRGSRQSPTGMMHNPHSARAPLDGC